MARQYIPASAIASVFDNTTTPAKQFEESAKVSQYEVNTVDLSNYLTSEEVWEHNVTFAEEVLRARKSFDVKRQPGHFAKYLEKKSMPTQNGEWEYYHLQSEADLNRYQSNADKAHESYENEVARAELSGAQVVGSVNPKLLESDSRYLKCHEDIDEELPELVTQYTYWMQQAATKRLQLRLIEAGIPEVTFATMKMTKEKQWEYWTIPTEADVEYAQDKANKFLQDILNAVNGEEESEPDEVDDEIDDCPFDEDDEEDLQNPLNAEVDDIIECGGHRFLIKEIVTQDEFVLEFRDTAGNLHSWKPETDGGQIVHC